MGKIDVAGLKIDALNKQQLLLEITERLKNGQKTFIITPYSEFLYRCFEKPHLFEMLNRADFAVPDGIGIFWAQKFLSLPLTAKNYWLKILQAFWQTVYSGAAIIFNPSYLKSVLPEKITGADLIWDLAKLANDNHWSIFLLGGHKDTPKIASEKLKSKFAQLKIAGFSTKDPHNPEAIKEVRAARPDLLLVAYGPIRQEQWIVKNLDQLPIKLAIGLGGTFDYLAKTKLSPPKFLRQMGLEWLFRLITQPHRMRRIFNATFGLIQGVIRHKVFMSYPLRDNIVVVILNKEGQVLVAQRHPANFQIDVLDNLDQQSRKDYWQLPQGGIEPGEQPLSAARREAQEETGLKELEFLGFSARRHTYIWHNALRKLRHNRAFANKGQSQMIAYFKFMGNNDSVRVDGHEFINYRWVKPEDLATIVHKERLELIKIVQEDLLSKAGQNAIISKV